MNYYYNHFKEIQSNVGVARGPVRHRNYYYYYRYYLSLLLTHWWRWHWNGTSHCSHAI